MGDIFPQPDRNDIATPESFGSFFSNMMFSDAGPPRTSRGATGQVQYVATTMSVSDILQGTFNYRNPTEMLAVNNIALTAQLSSLFTPAVDQLSKTGVHTDTNTSTPADGSEEEDPASGETATDAPTTNTVAEVLYAGKRLIDHPNYLAETSDNSGDQFIYGFVPEHIDEIGSALCLYSSSTKLAVIYPNLINCLWMICENGYILSGGLGMAGYKKSATSGNTSQHSWGGALDIGAVGRASDGQVFKITDSKSLSIVEEIYELVDAMSEIRKPTELGGPLDSPWADKPVFYTNNNHKNHMHFGYAKGRFGNILKQILNPGRTNTT